MRVHQVCLFTGVGVPTISKCKNTLYITIHSENFDEQHKNI